MVKGSLRALLFLTIPPPVSLLHHPTATQCVASRPPTCFPPPASSCPATSPPSPLRQKDLPQMCVQGCRSSASNPAVIFPTKARLFAWGRSPVNPNPCGSCASTPDPHSHSPLPRVETLMLTAPAQPPPQCSALTSLTVQNHSQDWAQGHHYKASSADPLPVWAWRGSVKCSSHRILNFPAQHGVPWGRGTHVFHSCDPAQCLAHTRCSEGIRTNG